MNDPMRSDILCRLSELSSLLPEMRFGQLIANMANLAVGPAQEASWDVEDSELLDAINQQIDNLAYRNSTNVNSVAASGR